MGGCCWLKKQGEPNIKCSEQLSRVPRPWYPQEISRYQGCFSLLTGMEGEKAEPVPVTPNADMAETC